MNTLAKTNKYPDARFWDRIAERYARKPVPDQQAYETKLAKTNHYLKPTDHVLEIGCGTGTTAVYHAPKVAQIHAVDISGKMIEIAKTKAQTANIDNVEFEVNSIDNVSNTTDRYDVVMAHSILHLLPDIERVLPTLNKILRPGGLLISSTACIADFFPLLRTIGFVGRKLRLMPYINIFGEERLKRQLSESGFIIEQCWQPKPKSSIYIVARKDKQ